MYSQLCSMPFNSRQLLTGRWETIFFSLREFQCVSLLKQTGSRQTGEKVWVFFTCVRAPQKSECPVAQWDEALHRERDVRRWVTSEEKQIRFREDKRIQRTEDSLDRCLGWSRVNSTLLPVMWVHAPGSGDCLGKGFTADRIPEDPAFTQTRDFREVLPWICCSPYILS